MIKLLIITLGIVATIVVYMIGVFLYNRWKTPLLNPFIVATVLLVVFLLIFSIHYEDYMMGAKWIHELLDPAVVALAYPLYQHRTIIKKKLKSIFVGTIVGGITGVVTGVGLSSLMGIDKQLIYTIAPKSVTTPVAMEISESLGGINSLTAILVTTAGISGATLSPYLFKAMKIKSPIAIGISLGSATHAIGTAKAFEYDSKAGTFSTISMILSALFVSIITPILIKLLIE